MGCALVNFDEATFRLVPFNRRVWAPKGIQPRCPFWFCNIKANIFGALVGGKKLYYEWYDRLNAHNFVNFLQRFMKTLDPSQKYVFILDNAPAHRAKMTLAFLKTLDNVFIEFLPTYSPELNCIETCWKIIRYHVTNSNFFETIESMRGGIEQFLGEHNFTLNSTHYLVR